MSFLTVVVSTRNRVESLRRTLVQLQRQTLSKDRYEVIVVDDGSADQTPELMAEYLKAGTLPLKYLRHDRKGPGFTQNRGIREAREPWVLLLCDDMVPQPDLLEAHYRAHERHPEPNVAVVGKVLQSPDLPDTVFLRNWDPFRYKNLDKCEELTYLHFCGCHVSFKRQFMLTHGMLLERPAAAHEDIEAGWRLYRDGGLRLLYGKDALAYHYHLETIDTACKRAYERGLNFDVLADRVSDPGVYIKNHLVTWKTIPIILRGFRAKTGILDEDRNVVRYFAREGLRRVLFHRLSVPYLFLPMIRRAERSPWLARFIRPLMIRGVVSYHFLQGVKELDRRRAAGEAPA